MYRTAYARRLMCVITGSLTVALLAPAPAPAQGRAPSVITGGVLKVTPQSATLLGQVTPNGAPTTYTFQYGTSVLYGKVTSPRAAGSGNAALNVTAGLTGLAPATTYHFRLVAHNRNGTVKGADRLLRTRPLPLGLALAATPNPVVFGQSTVLAGTLAGTGNANRQVLLQANPFPYTQGFTATGNPQLTNAAGRFAFPLPVPFNTQFRVVVPAPTQLVSPVVTVGVAVRVETTTNRRRVRRGGSVRFSGTVRPARPGAQFAIQTLRRGSWHKVAGGLVQGGGGASRYAKGVTIGRGGDYRVYVTLADGTYLAGAGRTVRIALRR